MKSLTSEEAQALSNEIAISHRETIRVLDWYNPKRKPLSREEKKLLRQAENLIIASTEDLTLAEAFDQKLIEPWFIALFEDQHVRVRDIVFSGKNDQTLHRLIMTAGEILGTDFDRISGVVFEHMSGTSLKHEDISRCIDNLHCRIYDLLAARVGKFDDDQVRYWDRKAQLEFSRLQNVTRKHPDDMKPAMTEMLRNWQAAVILAQSQPPVTHQQVMNHLALERGRDR